MRNTIAFLRATPLSAPDGETLARVAAQRVLAGWPAVETRNVDFAAE